MNRIKIIRSSLIITMGKENSMAKETLVTRTCINWSRKTTKFKVIHMNKMGMRCMRGGNKNSPELSCLGESR